MKLQDSSNIELISYASVNKEEVRENYLTWLNNSDIIQAFGPFSMLYPKTSTFIDESFERFTSRETIGFFIYHKDMKTFVGTCKLDKISIADRSTEIGIMIGDSSVHGQGIGKKTYKLLLEYAFEILGMNRVWGTCFSDNIGSKKLFETMGFTHEGTLRKAIFRKGTYLDNLYYSILRSEYVNLTK
ncbi:MAG: GNAT family protein [Weeksellaceae bacterium]